MSSAVTALSALGGIVAFLGGLYAVVRGISKQINATEANTTALGRVEEQLKASNGRVDDHEKRISWLEGAMNEQDRGRRGSPVPGARRGDGDQPGG